MWFVTSAWHEQNPIIKGPTYADLSSLHMTQIESFEQEGRHKYLSFSSEEAGTFCSANMFPEVRLTSTFTQ